MAKEKTVYVCSNCGQDSPKWVGKCPSCGMWNTYVEEVVRKEVVNKRPVSGIETAKAKPITLHEIVADDEPRIDLHDAELNRVLGGGLVQGSLVLIGGEPGIGKSTLVLQTVLRIPEKRILYVSGEESTRQLKLRADRLTSASSDCLIVCETSLEQIYVHIKNIRPDIVIIDSIQTISTETLESSPGSIAQVRECSASILRFAKETHTAVILIGHINKEGSIAGPKVLEHIVDTVLQFEGDQHYMYRILRSIKNRFGSTAELGIYEMRQDGLRQVSNPSELLLSQDHEGMSGIAIASAIEGIRPFLIETQALVSSAVYGNPTLCHRVRHPPHEYAAGRIGKTCRLQTGTERCISQYCRRIESERPGNRPCRHQRHPLQQHGHGHRARGVHGRRNRSVGRDTPGKPH